MAASAAAGSMGAPFIISARAADTLVVNAYGGEFQDVFMKTTVQPFEKKPERAVPWIWPPRGAGSH